MKRDIKKIIKKYKNFNSFRKVIKILEKTGNLPRKYKPHRLKGEWLGTLECHIEPDWLLIYKVDKRKKEIVLYRTGSYSDLF